ncbi:MAG: hypothetical protein ABIP79_06700 [Chitinophagaceae bacterium]
MKIKYLIPVLVTLSFISPVKAQNKLGDSLHIAATLKKLLSICKNVDFADAKVSDSGMFYKAAPYIIYRGKNKNRAWKDFANYNNPAEKKGVDEVCNRINATVNQDSTYKILKYFTEKESEGTWHVLLLTYKRKGVEKKASFAFLKIGERYGLGDID